MFPANMHSELEKLRIEKHIGNMCNVIFTYMTVSIFVQINRLCILSYEFCFKKSSSIIPQLILKF